MDTREKWNDRYRAATSGQRAAYVLTANLHLLPGSGTALELACGLGANALVLAAQGLSVTAWDISDVAIAAVRVRAAESRQTVRAEVRDVVACPPAPATFDVIVVSHFLERDIIPALIRALTPGGLVFYQTFTTQRVAGRGPRQAAYRLERQELLRLFAGLQVLFYREDADAGDTRKGIRDQAMYIGMKPA